MIRPLRVHDEEYDVWTVRKWNLQGAQKHPFTDRAAEPNSDGGDDNQHHQNRERSQGGANPAIPSRGVGADHHGGDPEPQQPGREDTEEERMQAGGEKASDQSQEANEDSVPGRRGSQRATTATASAMRANTAP